MTIHPLFQALKPTQEEDSRAAHLLCEGGWKYYLEHYFEFDGKQPNYLSSKYITLCPLFYFFEDHDGDNRKQAINQLLGLSDVLGIGVSINNNSIVEVKDPHSPKNKDRRILSARIQISPKELLTCNDQFLGYMQYKTRKPVLYNWEYLHERLSSDGALFYKYHWLFYPDDLLRDLNREMPQLYDTLFPGIPTSKL